MIFKAPWFFVLLFVLPLIGGLLLGTQRRALAAVSALRGSGDSAPRRSGRGRIAQQLGALLMIIVALAQPAWNPHPVRAGVKGRDLVIAMDISRSMLADDVYPSRLEAARFVLLESLGALQGQRIALITFAGSASVRVPLTLDHNFVRYMLQRVSTSDADVGSTALQAAIEKAFDSVLDESERGHQDLIIFTDGEDHISNVAEVAEALRNWSARVLIIGLGDPVAGARVPAVSGDQGWMLYQGREVVSRLDEKMLTQLAAEAPGVIYYPARTKPFDLMTLYRGMLIQTGELGVGDASQTVYDEGYGYCVALALLLYLISFGGRRHVALILLLLCSCTPNSDQSDAEYRSCFEQGRSSWAAAQMAAENSLQAGLAMLLESREFFLRAALLKPGDRPAAEQIAGVTAQMRELEKRVAESQQAGADLQQRLAQAVELLRELTEKEAQLSAQAQQLMRRRPPPPSSEKQGVADAVSSGQRHVTDGTQAVRQMVALMQATVRKMLAKAFDEEKKAAVTEFDEAVVLLDFACVAQQLIAEALAPDKTEWERAAPALLTAVRRMQEALEILSDQSRANAESQEPDAGDPDDWEYAEDQEWSAADEAAALSMPIQSQSFNSALNSRNLPLPNYSVAEIMAEEQENQLKRDQQNSARAGARVEKNW